MGNNTSAVRARKLVNSPDCLLQELRCPSFAGCDGIVATSPPDPAPRRCARCPDGTALRTAGAREESQQCRTAAQTPAWAREHSGEAVDNVSDQQCRQGRIHKLSSNQQDLALGSRIEQAKALTMISCGCGGALSLGGGQHGVKDCSSRYMAHQCRQSREQAHFVALGRTAPCMSSWPSPAQHFTHLGLLCCLHQHAHCVLRLQQCDSHASMPGRLMEAIEILHSEHSPE